MDTELRKRARRAAHGGPSGWAVSGETGETRDGAPAAGGSFPDPAPSRHRGSAPDPGAQAPDGLMPVRPALGRGISGETSSRS